jgi:septum formation protein
MNKSSLLSGFRRSEAPRRSTLRQERARLAQPGEERARQFVLASGSPRRLTLLNQIGLDPDALRPASIDETPKRGEMPRTLVTRLARAKAEAARDQVADDPELADAYVLAADTVVAVGRRILAKPRFVEEAIASIELLSGRAHRVLTGVCLITPDDKVRMRIVETRVRFKRLSQAEMEAYIASREWRGKAGGYAIQGLAGCFVQKIVGSYTNVVGLPLMEVCTLLSGEGFPVHFGWVNAADIDGED